MNISFSELDRYMFVDPAGKGRGNAGGLRRQRARQAIVVIAADWMHRVFVLHSWAGRLKASEFCARIVETYTRWAPRVCGIEDNAMQELFADLVKDEAVRQLGRVSMRGITQTSHVEKDWRIRTSLEPIINQGRLFLPEGTSQTDLELELRSFPTGRTKDIVDALASAVALIPARSQQKLVDDEAEDIVAYLRETGAPFWYIEQRAAELKQEAEHARRTRGSPGAWK